MSPTATSATPPRCSPLQRLGVEVWPIHTVQFSNHTGYGDGAGRAFDAAHIRELMQGFASATCFAAATACCPAMSGSAEIGEAILDAVARGESRKSRRALYCCDPVIGDVGRGVSSAPDVADFMRRRRCRPPIS